jgi:hypothetical protein
MRARIHSCIQIANRLSKFLWFATSGKGLIAGNAYALYSSEEIRIKWYERPHPTRVQLTCHSRLTHVSLASLLLDAQRRVEFIKTNCGSASGMANYYTPVIHLLEWITRSTAVVTACGGLVMSPEQDRVLLKTLEAWRHIRKPTYKKKTREAADNNRLEQMQHRNHWTSVVAVVNALRDTVLPRLNALTEQKPLSAGEKIEYFELLMFAIIVTRPCRPCTYYSAYVSSSLCRA